MKVKQIKRQVAVLAVTIFAALTVLFALATVTSHADTSYDPATRTYTMTGGTYAEEIVLDVNQPTTLNISGNNTLTYSGPCIYGDGDLVITGDGTLDASGGSIYCKDLTVNSGVTLKVGSELNAHGNVTLNSAEIKSENGYMYCGSYSNRETEHVFNNAQLGLPVALFGKSVLNNCTVNITSANPFFYAYDTTINGGTYNIIQEQNHNQALYIDQIAKVKNAVIKTNSASLIRNLEMTDSTLEIKASNVPNYASAALDGENLVFSGCKVTVEGDGFIGMEAYQQLIILKNTEMNVKGGRFGIVSKEVKITHSGGKFQATDPKIPIAAVAAVDMRDYTSQDVAGTFTLNSVKIKEPAGGTAEKIAVRANPSSPEMEATIAAIIDGKAPAMTVVLEADHKWDAGKVTKQPTAAEDGVKTYTCTVCGATKTEAIPKLTPQDSQGSQTPATGADGTPFGKGASVAAAEAAILALPNDNDPAGTAFGLLQLKASKVTKNSINLKWKAVPGAAKYILFANKCGTGNKYKKLAEVTGTSYTATQAAGAAIQKGTYYKFMMIAADANGKVLSTSKTVHAATKGGKVGNHKKVTVKKSVTKKAKKLKKGKTLKLKAKAVPQAKKLKVRKHRGIMYETSNSAVAQVNSKGAVKGVGKGTCYIYAYAQNGTCAKVKVTVK